MILFTAFKGIGNASNKLVSRFYGDKYFFSNSFSGIEKDVDSISSSYDKIYMFGLDKSLKGRVRIELQATKDDITLFTNFDTEKILKDLHNQDIVADIGNYSRASLCNYAYWHMLKKYDSNPIFIHIPSIKYIDDDFINAMKKVFNTAQNIYLQKEIWKYELYQKAELLYPFFRVRKIPTNAAMRTTGANLTNSHSKA